jgi:hypothetical protein
MSAAAIAQQHVERALAEARQEGADPDATARYMLGCIVQKYLAYRSIGDVRAELQFITDNCDPDTDYVFMRP